MILAMECVVLCIAFTLIILPALYKDPMVMIMSYPPNVIKRVEQLPQYAGCIKEREKKHISKKLRIPGTEDMVEDYKDYLFHVRGAIKGTVIGIMVAILSGVIILSAT